MIATCASVESAEFGESTEYAKVSLSIEGLRCGACVWVIERTLNAQPEVHRASVNFSSSRASIEFNKQDLKLSQILQLISKVGYSAKPFDARERELAIQKISRVFLQRLFIAGIANMQVMMYALPDYLTHEGDIANEHLQLLRWASLVITTPVVFYSAIPFFTGALADLKRLKPGMDVPFL